MAAYLPLCDLGRMLSYLLKRYSIWNFHLSLLSNQAYANFMIWYNTTLDSCYEVEV